MKLFRNVLLRPICIVLCVTLLIIFCIFYTNLFKKNQLKVNKQQVITIWQIDTFEGGKGSRAEYLRRQGENFSEIYGVYVDVTAITTEAAKINLSNGVIPDLISYGSCTYGVENYINEAYNTMVWCRGGYCFLSTETDDFSLITQENIIINEGKENLTSVVALMCGLQNAASANPTSAYVKLINGEYKYLLGTQRDIVRLITRGVNFYVQPITIFNDLYQNISVLTKEKGDTCEQFVDYLLDNSLDISSLYLFYDGLNLYDGILSVMEGLTFEFTVPNAVSIDFHNDILKAVKEQNADKLKSMLK